MVERVRDLMNEGALGEGIACVRIPSRASYEAQLAAAEAAQAQAEAEQAAGTAEEQAAEVDEAAGQEAVAAADVVADGEAAEFAEAGEADAAEQPEPAFAAPVLPAFDVDYGTWGIEYADGTVREFDAATGAFK